MGISSVFPGANPGQSRLELLGRRRGSDRIFRNGRRWFVTKVNHFYNGIPYEVRIKKENGVWYASVNYWKPPVDAEEKTHLCGAVDVGIAPLAVDSELVHYDNPKALYQMLRKLRRWQRALERRTVGSRGWREAQGRINAIHRRVNGLRENAHHQLSRQLVRKYAVLAIESLNVAGMDKLPHQAKAIRDAAIGRAHLSDIISRFEVMV